MARKQFTFYESFASALSRIKKKSDRADAYDAICRYALYGELPDLEKLPDSAAIAFDLIRPTLDVSKRKADAGKTGGTAKQDASKPEANRKQTASKSEANGKQTGSEGKPEARGNRKRGETGSDIEGEKEKEIENECSLSLLSPSQKPGVKFSPVDGPSFEQVEEFARMRKADGLAKDFFDYYAAAGWRDGEGKPVFNWQQKFISWELREKNRPKNMNRTGALAPVFTPSSPKKPGENAARMKEYLRQQKEG